VTATPTCPSCGLPRTTRYCGQCGERAVAPDELSFKRFLSALGEELLPGFDAEDGTAVRRMGGRVYRTVYTLFRHPGQLTADYIAGRRRPYMKPVQVFVTISLIFFFFGHNYFQFKLGEYEVVPIFGETAAAFRSEQQRMKITPAEYEQRFDERLATHKKAVMALTVPLFAVGFFPLFRRRRYGEHLVFSVHFFALQLLFMITFMYALFAIMIVVTDRLRESRPDVAQAIIGALNSESVIVAMVYVPMFLYLVAALRRVYGRGVLVNAFKALLLVCWHIVMLVVVFKTGLFFTTFFSLMWFG
jgi:hypothetical protein